jgi:hypothetical protein
MKTNKMVLRIGQTCFLLVVILFFGLPSWKGDTTGSLIVLRGTLLLFCVGRVFGIWKGWFEYPPLRPYAPPVLRVWTDNGVKVACANLDYELADQMRYRIALARRVDPAKLAPMVTVMAYFGPDPRGRIGKYLTGTMEDYLNLARLCRIQESRMFVDRFPDFTNSATVVDLRALYRLVFGEERGDELYAVASPE